MGGRVEDTSPMDSANNNYTAYNVLGLFFCGTVTNSTPPKNICIMFIIDIYLKLLNNYIYFELPNRH